MKTKTKIIIYSISILLLTYLFICIFQHKPEVQMVFTTVGVVIIQISNLIDCFKVKKDRR